MDKLMFKSIQREIDTVEMTLSAKTCFHTHSVLTKMSLFHVEFFSSVVFSPLTHARSSPDVPRVLHMQGTSLCSSERQPALLTQTLAHTCKFVVSVYNLRSPQITSARSVSCSSRQTSSFKDESTKQGFIVFVVRIGPLPKGSELGDRVKELSLVDICIKMGHFLFIVAFLG